MLHFFNPGHETAVLNDSPYYTPPAVQQKLQRDLALLPVWYAASDDLVWMEYRADEEDVAFLDSLHLDMPELADRRRLSSCAPLLKGRELALWGVSPAGIQLFKQINKQYGTDLLLPEWNPSFKDLCSREYAKKCLEYLRTAIPGIAADIVPEYYTSTEAVIDTLRQVSEPHIVKSPYSSSGRGLLWLSPGETDRASRQLLQGMLNRQSKVSLERALDKKIDFSMQFYSDGKGSLLFQGVSLFETDSKGNYTATLVASQSKIRETMLASFPDWSFYEPLCVEHLSRFLKQHYAPLYKGYIGVDMLVYEDGGLRLYPCVEINMRATMGYVCLRLHEKLCEQETTGKFYIDFFRDPKELAFQHRKKTQEHPPVFHEGKLVSGYFPLCPAKQDSHYTAYLEIFS